MNNAFHKQKALPRAQTVDTSAMHIEWNSLAKHETV